MKTIKDAVIYHNGFWPFEDGGFLVYHKKENEYSVSYDNCIHSHAEQIVCNEQEFEAEAKRMGYISGYRWGVEYPTNGERPNLPDDVIVEPEADMLHCAFTPEPVSFYNWSQIKAFCITDPRYNPADTSYLNASTQAQSLTHSEEGLTHSEWWDYENKKQIGAVPVGTFCEVYNAEFIPNAEWEVCEILYVGKLTYVYESESCSERSAHAGNLSFRPLDHATRKSELERKKVIEAAMDLTDRVTPTHRDICEALFDAGVLVLPSANCNTKD